MSSDSMSDRPPIIVTDATCDLPPDLLAHYGIHRLPLRIQFGDELYHSGVNMNPAQFATRLAQGDIWPTTAHPTDDEAHDFFMKLGAAEGQPILGIFVSSGLSSTINAARRGVNAIPHHRVTFWDSHMISNALGLQVLTAARAAQAGYTIPQILPLLEQALEDTHFLFCLDDITPLVRGGRIGRVSWMVASTLRLKPIITISKEPETFGTYVSTSERPRSMSAAVRAFVRDVERQAGDQSTLRAIISYGNDDMKLLGEELASLLRRQFDCVLLELAESTPVLGVHVGLRALAIAFAIGDWPV